MSDSFKDREQGFEAKQKLDEELKFKAAARRDKLLGLWAAEKQGLSGADAEAYAKSVVIADLEEPGDEDVIRKVVADLADKGVSEAEIRQELARLGPIAEAEVKGEA